MSSSVQQRPTLFEAAYQELRDKLADVSQQKVDRALLSEAGMTLAQRELALVFPGKDRAPPTVANLKRYIDALIIGAETLTHHVAAFGGIPAPTDEFDRHGLKPMSLAYSATAEERVAVASELLALVHASLRIRTDNPRDVFQKGGGGGS